MHTLSGNDFALGKSNAAPGIFERKALLFEGSGDGDLAVLGKAGDLKAHVAAEIRSQFFRKDKPGRSRTIADSDDIADIFIIRSEGDVDHIFLFCFVIIHGHLAMAVARVPDHHIVIVGREGSIDCYDRSGSYRKGRSFHIPYTELVGRIIIQRRFSGCTCYVSFHRDFSDHAAGVHKRDPESFCVGFFRVGGIGILPVDGIAVFFIRRDFEVVFSILVFAEIDVADALEVSTRDILVFRDGQDIVADLNGIPDKILFRVIRAFRQLVVLVSKLEGSFAQSAVVHRVIRKIHLVGDSIFACKIGRLLLAVLDVIQNGPADLVAFFGRSLEGAVQSVKVPGCLGDGSAACGSETDGIPGSAHCIFRMHLLGRTAPALVVVRVGLLHFFLRDGCSVRACFGPCFFGGDHGELPVFRGYTGIGRYLRVVFIDDHGRAGGA